MGTTTISELEKSNTGPVWVINKTQAADRALLVLSVPRTNGQGVDSVKIPVTFLPIDLTGQVAKRQLLNSGEFRRAVSTGYLELVDPSEAEKVMKQPGAREEMLRLAEADRAITAASQRLTAGSEGTEAATTNISPRVQQFLVSMEEAVDPITTLNTLRSMGRLNEEELKAIGTAAENKRGFDIVVQYCEEQIESQQ